MSGKRANRQRGISSLEVLVVLSLALGISACAMPNILGTADAIQLRNTANNLAQLAQRGRSAAIVDDRSVQIRCNSSSTYAWADENNDSSVTPHTTEAMLIAQLPRKIAFTSAGAPPLTSMGLSYAVSTGFPAFNARGLPCTFSGSSCPAQAGGFVFYITQSRIYGGPGWAAVTVSPAGRIRAWVWDGNSWQ